ncbi:MAG TPA: hypothetical protein V6D21_16200, partial [Candidatus Obscuribacterales bacterium]
VGGCHPVTKPFPDRGAFALLNRGCHVGYDCYVFVEVRLVSMSTTLTALLRFVKSFYIRVLDN